MVQARTHQPDCRRSAVGLKIFTLTVGEAPPNTREPTGQEPDGCDVKAWGGARALQLVAPPVVRRASCVALRRRRLRRTERVAERLHVDGELIAEAPSGSRSVPCRMATTAGAP